ncbi:hypothetical protein [Bradyrhizobium sp. HKCCYLS20291]|uniref:hypothetical protein n=1 Tax=Bradyrhizobium sp. HKCCYLS20291 TaxID=3420766 RepID=UPI003EBFCA3A
MIRQFFMDTFASTAISDFLWVAATSEIALSGLGLLIAVAGVVGYLPIVSTLLGGYGKVAKLVFILALAALLFLLGFRTADNRAEAKVLRADVARKDEVIAAKDFDLRLALEAAEAAQKQRDQAALRAREAQDEIDDYAQRVKARPNASCVLAPSDFPGGLPDDGKR